MDTSKAKGLPLTPKQSAFAGFVAEGKNYTASYRLAYNAKNMSNNAISIEGYKLMKKEHVKLQVDLLKANNSTATKAHEHTRQAWILERLKEEALDQDNNASTRVRALELLGKGAGLFDSTQTVVVENRTPTQIEAELSEKLGILFD
jgi:hypothetical protein